MMLGRLAATEEAFKESYPMARTGMRDGKPFFGALSCYTKMSVTSPVLAYSALRLLALRS